MFTNMSMQLSLFVEYSILANQITNISLQYHAVRSFNTNCFRWTGQPAQDSPRCFVIDEQLHWNPMAHSNKLC